MILQLILIFKYLSTHVETNTSGNNDRSMLPILFILFSIRCACVACGCFFGIYISLSLSLFPVPLDFPTLTSPIFKLRCLQQGCGRQKGGFKLSVHLLYRVAGFHPSAHSHLGNNTHLPIRAHKFAIFRHEHL